MEGRSDALKLWNKYRKIKPRLNVVFAKLCYTPQSTDIYREYHSVCPLVGIGTFPSPLSSASVPLPPEPRGVGRLARGWGVGESQFRQYRRLEKSLALCMPTLWLHSFICSYPHPPSKIDRMLSIYLSLEVLYTLWVEGSYSTWVSCRGGDINRWLFSHFLIFLPILYTNQTTIFMWFLHIDHLDTQITKHLQASLRNLLESGFCGNCVPFYEPSPPGSLQKLSRPTEQNRTPLYFFKQKKNTNYKQLLLNRFSVGIKGFALV